MIECDVEQKNGGPTLRLIWGVSGRKADEMLEVGLSNLWSFEFEDDRPKVIPLYIMHPRMNLSGEYADVMLYLTARAFAILKDADFDDHEGYLQEARYDVEKAIIGYEDLRLPRMYRDFIWMMGQPHFRGEKFSTGQFETRYWVGHYGVPGRQELREVHNFLMMGMPSIRHVQGPWVPDVHLDFRGATSNETLWFRRFAFEREDDAILCSLVED